MRVENEKTKGIAGFVVSILLHGIFFAGCYALDAASDETVYVTGQPADNSQEEIAQLPEKS